MCETSYTETVREIQEILFSKYLFFQRTFKLGQTPQF